VLLELDPDMEEAAASLNANTPTILRRIVLKNLLPAIAGRQRDERWSRRLTGD